MGFGVVRRLFNVAAEGAEVAVGQGASRELFTAGAGAGAGAVL